NRLSAASRWRSSGAWTAGKRSGSGAERASEQVLYRASAVGLDPPSAGAGKVHVCHARRVGVAAPLPRFAGPGKPAALLLIEDVQRLVAEFRELGAPSGAASHRVVIQDGADHIDLL